MRRILWWTGKELREHRVALVLLLVGLIVGSWYWAWEGRGRPNDAGPLAEPYPADAPIPHRYSRVDGWEEPLVVSLGVVLVVLAGGLFASDLRRGCGVLTARTPGGWGAAFAGKFLFLLVALLGTLLIHGLLLGRLAAHYHLMERGGPVDLLWLGPVSETYITGICALLAAAPVLLLASMALPYVGVPAVVGAAVALGLALPFAWIDSDEEYLFEWWLGSVRLLLAFVALVALAVAAWVWWGQVRSGRSRLRVVLSGASVLLLAAGATSGAAFAARAVYRSYSLDDPDVQISRIIVGPEGRYAFVMAGRGDPSPTFGLPTWGGGRARAFTIDLATSAARLIEGCSVERVPTIYTRRMAIDAPVVRVRTHYLGALDGWEGSWLDTLTGAEIARAATRDGVLPAAAQATLEAGMERRWAVRDTDGRRVWLDESGLRVRVGEAIPTTTVLDLPLPLRQATGLRHIHRGWTLQWGSGGAGPLASALASGTVASVDAMDGRVRHLTVDRIHPRGMESVAWLTPHEVLLTPRWGANLATDPHAWRVLDLDVGASRLALPQGSAVAARLVPLGMLGPTSVLVYEPSASGRLAILYLRDGQTRPVTWDRDPPASVQRAFCLEKQLTPTEGGGALLVDLAVDEASVGPRPDERLPILQDEGWIGGGTTMDGKQRLRHVMAVVGADGSAWRLEVRARYYAAQLLGIDAQGRVWMLEDARQIVRYGPGSAVREVLFPRAP